MTTSIIDVNIHGSSFPATYIGNGTLIGNPMACDMEPARISGYFTGPGNAVQIPVGFQPSYVCCADETNVIIWEWYRGQAATHAWKTVTAGTKTVDTGTAISVSSDPGGNCVVTLSAGLCASAANICYCIEA